MNEQVKLKLKALSGTIKYHDKQTLALFAKYSYRSVSMNAFGFKLDWCLQLLKDNRWNNIVSVTTFEWSIMLIQWICVLWLAWGNKKNQTLSSTLAFAFVNSN